MRKYAGVTAPISLAATLLILAPQIAHAGPSASTKAAGTVSITDVTMVEGNGGTQTYFFVAILTGDSDPFSVDYATANGSASAGSDYTAANGTLQFTGFDAEQRGFFITVSGDTEFETNENFFVNLSNIQVGVNGPPAGLGLPTIADGQGAGTITNDDVDPGGNATVSINDVTAAEGDNGSKNFSFTVTLSAASDAFTVQAATADGSATAGSDYTAKTSSLSFNGTAGETKTFNVSVHGDATDEPNETFTVNLSNIARSAKPTISDGQGVGTITDDDGGGGGGSLSISTTDFGFDASCSCGKFDVTSDGPLAPIRNDLTGTEEIWFTLERNAKRFLPGGLVEETIAVCAEFNDSEDDRAVNLLFDVNGARGRASESVGLIQDNNSNIFNSSTISFNFLTGFHTVGVPVGIQQASFGVRAWARPAVRPQEKGACRPSRSLAMDSVNGGAESVFLDAPGVDETETRLGSSKKVGTWSRASVRGLADLQRGFRDYNGDGLEEIGVTGSELDGAGRGAWVQQYNGKGKRQMNLFAGKKFPALQVLAMDTDGNGKAEPIVLGTQESGATELQLRSSKGGTQDRKAASLAGSTGTLLLSLENDGKRGEEIGIVYKAKNGTGRFAVWDRTGNKLKKLAEHTVIDAKSEFHQWLQVDLDGDGREEIAATYAGASGRGATLRVVDPRSGETLVNKKVLSGGFEEPVWTLGDYDPDSPGPELLVGYRRKGSGALFFKVLAGNGTQLSKSRSIGGKPVQTWGSIQGRPGPKGTVRDLVLVGFSRPNGDAAFEVWDPSKKTAKRVGGGTVASDDFEVLSWQAGDFDGDPDNGWELVVVTRSLGDRNIGFQLFGRDGKALGNRVQAFDSTHVGLTVSSTVFARKGRSDLALMARTVGGQPELHVWNVNGEALLKKLAVLSKDVE